MFHQTRSIELQSGLYEGRKWTSIRLMPAQALHSFGVQPLDPAVDGSRAAEQECNDGGPGVSIVQEQEDVGAESAVGVAVVAASVE